MMLHKDGIKKSLCKRCGCVVDGAKSTKGNEKITSANPNRQKTTLWVLRFNPLFIQFSFPISLRLSKTFSKIKGYYRFIALCRVFCIGNRENLQKIDFWIKCCVGKGKTKVQRTLATSVRFQDVLLMNNN